MSTITPLSPLPQLGSSTDRPGGQQQNLGHTIVGEVLKATVLSSRANDQYLLDFGGTKIPVSSQTPLSEGQVLQLQISQTTPQVELKIVSEASSLLAGKPLVLLGNAIDLRSLVSLLQQGTPPSFSSLSSPSATVLSSFLPPELNSIIGSSGGGAILQNLFNRLGLDLERLLLQRKTDTAQNTLKATLLEVISRFQGSEPITEQASKLLTTLELYQFSQIQLTSGNALIFPLPLPFLEQGYLLIEDYSQEYGQSQGSADNQKFSLHLFMTELGSIQIFFLQNEDTLFVKLLFDSEEKVQFVSQYTGLLETVLTSRHKRVISFASGAESPANTLARRLLPEGQSLIDTMV